MKVLKQIGLLGAGLTLMGALGDVAGAACQGQPPQTAERLETQAAALPRESSSRTAKKGAPTPEAKRAFVKEDSASAHLPPPGYQIGVEDELQISVWREPELSQTVVVRPDGMISLPLLNDIQVVGLSTTELRTLLTERLHSLVNDPQVTVIVRAIRSRKVYVAGQVNRPGAFPLVGHKTVLELISEAGGLGPFAKRGSIYVLRNNRGKQIRLPFNYKRAIAGREKDIDLLPSDMVVVP